MRLWVMFVMRTGGTDRGGGSQIFIKPGKIRFLIVFSALVLIVAGGYLLTRNRKHPEKTVLDRILSVGQVTVIIRNNPWCYYIYQGQPRGFEYEMARAFADYLGVALKIKVAHDWERMIPDLLAGKGDFIAAGMTITPARRRRAAFSTEYLSARPYVIIRRGSQTIKSPAALAGKTIHVAAGSSYHERLEALQTSGIDLNIILHRKLETTDLIRMVAERKIDMTIADKRVARLTQRYNPWVDLATPINDAQSLGWAVAPGADNLLQRINEFLTTIKSNGELERMYHRYFFGIDRFDFVDLRAFHRKIRQVLPLYRGYIRQFADQYGFDWRLVAAQMYQESHFNPLARSLRDAHGLMQITVKTAENMGVVDIYDPCQNIEAGVRHLKALYDFYDHATGEDRLMLALAAYNVGIGHILDARNIARDRGLDPEKWSSLEKTLPLLAKREYYRSAQYGYCRGSEPIAYVHKINLYYDILRFQDMVAQAH